MQVGASNNQLTTFGARIPTGRNAPTTSQEAGTLRIRAGQPLPEGVDALLTPRDMQQLYQQGYLDVKRTFTTMESNEGIFTLTAKLAAALVGPSRSVGAIQIDPLFLEMIKDPNAEVGFGFTRVRNETLEVMPSPVADPAIQAAPPPSITPPPRIPLLVNPNDPRTQPRPTREVEPVDTITPGQPQTGSVSFRGLFNHDSTDERNNSLIGHINTLGSQSFMSLTVTAGSNALAGGTYNNALTANRSSVFRDPITRGGNSDQVHRDFVQEHFGVDILGSRSSRAAHVPVGDRHRVVPSSEGPTGEGTSAVQPSDRFLRAATELFFKSTGKDGVQTSGGRPYPTQILQRNTDIITNVNQVFVPDEDGEGLTINREAQFDIDPDVRNVLTDIVKKQNPGISDAELEQEVRNLAVYAQSYLEHRKYEVDANITVNAETIGDAENYLANTNRASLPPEMQTVYDEVQNAVTAYRAGDGAGAAQTVSDLNTNISTLNQTNISSGSIETMQNTIETQIERLPSEGPNSPDQTPVAGFENFKKATNPEGQTVLVPRDQALGEGFTAVEPDTVTLADWGTRESPGPLQSMVLATANTREPATPDLRNTLETAQGNIERLDALAEAMPGQPVDPRSISAFQQSITEQIGIIQEGIAALEANPNRTPEENELLTTLKEGKTKLEQDFATVQEKVTAKLQEQERAAVLAEGQTGQPSSGTDYLASVGQNLDQFQTYVRTAIADGQISQQEKTDMQAFVTTTSDNLVQYLSSRGVSMTGTNAVHQLNSVTQADLISAGFNATEANDMMGTIDRLQFAQASLNVTSEGTHTARLYESVQQLNRRLDEFDQVEVAKTAFRGEMQAFARDNEALFRQTISMIYEPNEMSAQTMDSLVEMAQSGNMPMPPNIGFTDRSQLGGGNGAYIEQGRNGEPVILLARDLMSNPGAMRSVFFEEMFHHLERELGLADSTGDEGQVGATVMTELQRNPDANLEQLSRAGEAVRMEETPNVGGDVARMNPDGIDHGTLRQNITDERGNVIAQSGSRIEFSTNATAPVTDRQATTPGQAPAAPAQSPPRPDGRASIQYNREPGVDLNVRGINPHQSNIRGASREAAIASAFNTMINNSNGRVPDELRLTADAIQLDANGNVTGVRVNNETLSLEGLAERMITLRNGGNGPVDPQEKDLLTQALTQAAQSQNSVYDRRIGADRSQLTDNYATGTSNATQEYDTEPTGGAQLMDQISENVGTMLLTIGQKLDELAYKLQQIIDQFFGEVAMRLQSQDPNANIAQKVVYGDTGWHGNDSDVAMGRPQDDVRQQTNQIRERTLNPNRPYSTNPNADPNYLQTDENGHSPTTQAVAERSDAFRRGDFSRRSLAQNEVSTWEAIRNAGRTNA